MIEMTRLLATPSRSLPSSWTRRPINMRAILAATTCVSALATGACSSVPDVSTERVAKSETIVQQAAQTIGTSESGAVELQQAKARLEMAKKALSDKRPVEAERAGLQAELHADLAIAQMEGAAASGAADEMRASIEALRKEAERNSPTLQ